MTSSHSPNAFQSFNKTDGPAIVLMLTPIVALGISLWALINHIIPTVTKWIGGNEEDSESYINYMFYIGMGGSLIFKQYYRGNKRAILMWRDQLIERFRYSVSFKYF